MLSQAVGWVAYALDYKGRPVAVSNLMAAFADRGITQNQASRLARASYQTFAKTFLDLFWSKRLDSNNYDQTVKIVFDDPETERIAKARGAIWVTPHFGNFELISLGMGFRGFDFTIVAQDFKNPALTEVFRELREHGGGTIISQQGAMLRLMKALKSGGHIALLTDLNIKPSKIATVLNAFGMEICATLLHVDLARRLNLPVIPCTCEPLSDGTYRGHMHAHFEPKDFASNHDMAQAVWDTFEKVIAEQPEAWLWMYKHWRYLPSRELCADYPFYSNVNRDFTKMRERVRLMR